MAIAALPGLTASIARYMHEVVIRLCETQYIELSVECSLAPFVPLNPLLSLPKIRVASANSPCTFSKTKNPRFKRSVMESQALKYDRSLAFWENRTT